MLKLLKKKEKKKEKENKRTNNINNEKDKINKTLIYACGSVNCDEKNVEYLLQNGADPKYVVKLV